MALVTIKKTGQPTLRILASALDQHVKLGWRHVEDEVLPVGQEVDIPAAHDGSTCTIADCPECAKEKGEAPKKNETLKIKAGQK